MQGGRMMDNMFDPEYLLERNFVKGLRAVFEKDKRFVYNKNQELTEVCITTDFPDDMEAPLKIPHIVVSNVTFQNNPQNSFTYNFYRDVAYKGMSNGSQEYAHIIPYGISIICSGDRNGSKDLAARVNWWLSFGASEYFSETLGLQLNNIQKGTSNISKQFGEKVFDTPIHVQGTLYWVGRKGPENAFADLDTPLTNVKLNFKK